MIEILFFVFMLTAGLGALLLFNSKKSQVNQTNEIVSNLSDSKIIDMFLDATDSKAPISERIRLEGAAIILMRESRERRELSVSNFDFAGKIVRMDVFRKAKEGKDNDQHTKNG